VRRIVSADWFKQIQRFPTYDNKSGLQTLPDSQAGATPQKKAAPKFQNGFSQY
jgi:hypothetical protein